MEDLKTGKPIQLEGGDHQLFKIVQSDDDDLAKLISKLPREKGWSDEYYILYKGGWFPQIGLGPKYAITAHKMFQARDTDIILLTVPKSGTVWLKALAFAISNRHKCKDLSQHPLLTSNPHDLVPFLESKPFSNEGYFPLSRRIFSTHVPYNLLSESIKSSTCPVIYLCRNPYDIFISLWHFMTKRIRPESGEHTSMSDALDIFCKGITGFGPIWDHMLGSWQESLEHPQKVLFLMYEDLKKDTVGCIKRMGEFMGVPFSPEEEKEGVMEEISRLCSFGNLSELEVNKTGKSLFHFENKDIFRKGEVGDWINHLTPEMKKRLDEMVEEKFGALGSKFKT